MTYTVETKAGRKLDFCCDTFLHILQITKHRILGVFLRFQLEGLHAKVLVEASGGNHTKHLFDVQFVAVVQVH